MANKSSPAFEFIQAKLEKNPNASFAEIRDAGAQRGLTLYPILYGRVKALMGLIPGKTGRRGEAAAGGSGAAAAPARRGPGRPKGSKNKPKADSGQMQKRGPGRPRKNPLPETFNGAAKRGRSQTAMEAAGGLVQQIERIQRENEQMREAIDQIRGLLDQIARR